MENDYNLPASLFPHIGDLFLDCVCGSVPLLRIAFSRETSEVMYEVFCPNCRRNCGMVSMYDLDFCTMSEDWNSMIDEV